MVVYLVYLVCFEFVVNVLYCFVIIELIGFLEMKVKVYFILLFKYIVGVWKCYSFIFDVKVKWGNRVSE